MKRKHKTSAIELEMQVNQVVDPTVDPLKYVKNLIEKTSIDEMAEVHQACKKHFHHAANNYIQVAFYELVKKNIMIQQSEQADEILAKSQKFNFITIDVVKIKKEISAIMARILFGITVNLSTDSLEESEPKKQSNESDSKKINIQMQ
jgi:hypothetical protein